MPPIYVPPRGGPQPAQSLLDQGRITGGAGPTGLDQMTRLYNTDNPAAGGMGSYPSGRGAGFPAGQSVPSDLVRRYLDTVGTGQGDASAWAKVLGGAANVAQTARGQATGMPSQTVDVSGAPAQRTADTAVLDRLAKNGQVSVDELLQQGVINLSDARALAAIGFDAAAAKQGLDARYADARAQQPGEAELTPQQALDSMSVEADVPSDLLRNVLAAQVAQFQSQAQAAGNARIGDLAATLAARQKQADQINAAYQAGRRSAPSAPEVKSDLAATEQGRYKTAGAAQPAAYTVLDTGGGALDTNVADKVVQLADGIKQQAQVQAAQERISALSDMLKSAATAEQRTALAEQKVLNKAGDDAARAAQESAAADWGLSKLNETISQIKPDSLASAGVNADALKSKSFAGDLTSYYADGGNDAQAMQRFFGLTSKDSVPPEVLRLLQYAKVAAGSSGSGLSATVKSQRDEYLASLSGAGGK